MVSEPLTKDSIFGVWLQWSAISVYWIGISSPDWSFPCVSSPDWSFFNKFIADFFTERDHICGIDCAESTWPMDDIWEWVISRHQISIKRTCYLGRLVFLSFLAIFSEGGHMIWFVIILISKTVFIRSVQNSGSEDNLWDSCSGG